jgi:acetyl-CoA carboxylase biotin carboxyl carrier protein
MNDAARALEALVETRPEGGLLVRSPRVGIYRGAPRAGARRTAGDTIGRIAALNQAADLVLPAGAEGIVADVAIRPRMEPVEYGQPLFTLMPFPSGEALSHPHGLVVSPAALAGSGDRGIPEGCFAVMSPIEGTFYRGPSPGASPFVRPGETIETGRTLGLVEAMKSFNAVVYGGAGLPARAEVVEPRAGDGAEVAQGAVLLVLKPA